MARAKITRLRGAPLLAWFVVMLVLGAGLLAKHVAALPTPADGERLGASLGELRRPEERGRWLAVHVLYADCRCSLRIADHLGEGPRPSGYSEIVLWVGDDAPSPRLAQRGLDVRRVTGADLERHGIEAAPMLVALDPSNRVQYAGGYTERKQGPVISDVRILDAVRGGAHVASLPVLGCAVSARLRQELSALPSP